MKQRSIESACAFSGYPHHRLKGSTRFRARIGDYRIIYSFEVERNAIHLLAIGHRREIYKTT
ncbi:MAG: type II toxin-antitoxin system RelE family toxin [Chthoniobacterales bacterium]